MQRWSTTLVLFSAPALIWSISSTHALANQSWEGPGRIIRGAGRGAAVPALQLETQANRVRFLSGPDAGEQIELDDQDSAETETGTWQFSRTNSRLEATLYQDDPYRVIFYRLELQ
ncbi:MAG: hypothetical protein AAGF01_13530 [Cyanobacteria bacterium P01_G01_bin.38]